MGSRRSSPRTRSSSPKSRRRRRPRWRARSTSCASRVRCFARSTKWVSPRRRPFRYAARRGCEVGAVHPARPGWEGHLRGGEDGQREDRCVPAAHSGAIAVVMRAKLNRRYKNNARNLIRVLIVAPTRELAQQVFTIATKLAKARSSAGVSRVVHDDHVLPGGGRAAAAVAGGGSAAASGHRGVHAGANDRSRAQLEERGSGRRGGGDSRRSGPPAGAGLHRGAARAAPTLSGEAADAAVLGDDDGRRVVADQPVAAEAGARVRRPGEPRGGQAGAGRRGRSVLCRSSSA